MQQEEEFDVFYFKIWRELKLLSNNAAHVRMNT